MCLGPVALKPMDSVIETSKQLMDSMLAAMDKGSLHAFFEDYVADDGVWESNGLLVNEKAEGRPAMLRHYNKVLATSWGGNGSSMCIQTHSYEEIPSKDGTSACQFIFETHITLEGQTVKRDRRWTFHIDDITGLITKIQCAPRKGNALPPSPPASDRPCEHNCWDSVRVKRQWCLLRCRVCESQWRLPTGSFVKCQAFSTKPGCFAGTSCTFIHMNSRKQTLAERQLAIDFADHPEILERARVGASSRPFKKRTGRSRKSRKAAKRNVSPPPVVPAAARSSSVKLARDRFHFSGTRSRSLDVCTHGK
eukprot:TRINITY_DN3080_c0_g1_i3.p1 TRINITY_DN3080_c0_g1~~TRINITY_DN3080_c0_g1_i3.p1  ORF type:complete len:308 (+),score=51.56 TRINITY_DN3080_c0_g1_i3:52-975(+)